MAKDCHDTALSYLEHRARSAHEMKTHLNAKGFSEEEIEDELITLTELHYVDDARYCSDYIRYGINKGRGPVRLQHELREKGISTGLIKASLEDGFDQQNEREAALKEAKKLLKGMETGETDEKLLAKIGRKLSTLGYHTDIIYEIISKIRKS